MQTEDSKRILLDDTLLPDVFIGKYMMQLSEAAVKCYLYAKMAMKNGISIHADDLGARLGMQTDEIQAALLELSGKSLILPWKKGEKIQFEDLKRVEVDEYVYQKRKETLAQPKEAPVEVQARIQLERSIERTFFHGSMNTRWCLCISKFLDEYGFDAQVVYKLFQHCQEKKRLKWEKDVDEIARSWAKKGVKTFEDLSVLLAKDEQIQVIMRRLGRILRRRMTQFDENAIDKWVNELPYPYEVIELAVKQMCSYSNSYSLDEADKILRLWFNMKLENIPDIIEFEKEQAKKNKKKYQENKQSRFQNAPAKQNFKSVDYDDEQLAGLVYEPEEYLARMQEKDNSAII